MERDRRLHWLAGGDGISLSVAEGGQADGPPVILLHGFSQSNLCWHRQFSGDLARQCRLVAPDLRGHGGSDKPLASAAYGEGRLWADDLAAVIDGLALDRPVLVAWSYAGAVVGDYLRHRGTSAIAGIVMVGAVARLGPAAVPLLGPDLLRNTPGLLSSDPWRNLVAARRFLRGTVAGAMTGDDHEIALATLMMVPPAVRRGLMGRSEDYADVLASLGLPVLVMTGTLDTMVRPAMAEHIAGIVPGARLSRFAGVGHAPFLEQPERFDREMVAFVAEVRG